MRKILFTSAALAAVLAMSPLSQAAHSDYGCHNCHMPHHALTEDDPGGSWGVPLWSDAQTSDGLPVFTLYSSKTFNALATDIGQPDGPSKLCLGCHDGSYIAFSFMPESDAIFSPTDLANSHPISFTYNSALAAKVANGGLYDPAVALSGLGGTVEQDLLDAKGKLQCTSCHDIHTTGKGEYMLRYDYSVATGTDKVICRVCHNK